jgi:thiol-activated cytolysin
MRWMAFTMAATIALGDPMLVCAQSGANVDAFIRSLTYDPRVLLATREPGSTDSVPGRQAVGNGVIICSNERRDLTDTLAKVTVMSPVGGVVYPGALVKANRNLADGKPDPLALPRAPVTLSVNLPGIGANGVATVASPTNSSVQTAIQGILEKWFGTSAGLGYSNPGNSVLKVAKAYNAQQVSLALGFGTKWADNEVTANLSIASKNESSTAIALYQQIFYSVTADTPPSLAGWFGEGVSVGDLRREMNDDNPPAYVRSVDYGRIIMVRMDTSSAETKGDLEGTLKYLTTGGQQIDANTASKFSSIANNSTFAVTVIGGSATTAGKSMELSDFQKTFGEVIKNDATFRRDNPGVPISYVVAFMKDNQVAQFGFTTNYNQSECKEFNNGYVVVQNSGAYVAKFKVTWDKTDETGKGLVPGIWESGNTTSSYRKTVELPGDAKDVRITAEEYTGLIWEPTREAMNVAESGPTNKCYRIKGTTLNPSWDNDCENNHR